MRAYAAILFAATVAAGCADTRGVRYVYQDGQFGVIGIPENTDRWPTHYRSKAEELMTSHFPDGHEIVRAEEVVEGSRTLKVEGSGTAELSATLPTEVLKLAKLGRTTSHSRADQVKIKECRIIYHKALRPSFDGYAEVATLDPVRYVDPNVAAQRKSAQDDSANAGAKAPARSHDPAAEPTRSRVKAVD